MLQEISVENIAIIDRADLVLTDGFTALTGETGAGKSLVIDSIGLALGGRADSDLVRSGASKGVVVLRALVEGATKDRCLEMGIDVADGELLVHREVSAKGGSTVRINGRPSSVGMLREIGSLLVDLHGQHDHQSLLVPERQVDFLDAWIGSECTMAKETVAAKHEDYEAIKRKLNALRTSRRDREQRIDMLRFQIEEIESVSPKAGELVEQEALLQRMQHAEKLGQAAFGALDLMQEREGSAIENLSSALSSLQHVANLDSELESLLEPLQAALVHLEDGSRDLRRYAESMDFEPNALELTAGRVDSLKKLLRKYGDSEEAVLDYLNKAKLELEALQGTGSSEEELTEALEKAKAVRDEAAEKLTKLRKAKAKEFTSQTLSHIRDLAMEKAEFDVIFGEKLCEADGKDTVEFSFSANPGEPMMALSRVASGGELSRVMLAIKAASAGRAGVPTLIFDEVDTGLSGRAAAIMAKKLQELAMHRQVIVISHLPQIAAKSEVHWKIDKAVTKGRSITTLRKMEGDERIHEIARMVAGETIGDSALANAKELLKA